MAIMTNTFGIQSIWRLLAASLVLFCCVLAAQATRAQETSPAKVGAGQGGDEAEYVVAAKLLPSSTAGFVRIPDLPQFCDAWKKTQLGLLFDDPAMEPFIESQRDRAKNYFESMDSRIGLRPQDLFDIGSGEVAMSFLPFEQDKRRPFAICVIADIRGQVDKAEEAAKQIDEDLRAGGAIRKDVKYGDEVIRVYTTKPKPGQLKVEQVALTWNQVRLVAADRDSVVQNVLDAASGKSTAKPLSELPLFKKVMEDSAASLDKSKDNDAVVSWQWFAKPFAMGRILRELFEYDRGNQLDVIALLERQGFDVIEAFGGTGALAGDRFDVLHRGLILAPGKLEKGARILQMFNRPVADAPGWVPTDTGSFTRMNWKMEEAFWASETLVDDAVDDKIFLDMIDGIKNDAEGPQIDIAKNFLPHLDDQLLLITDNTQPAGPESDRMLVAIRLTNAEAVRRVVEKAMKNEPDAAKLDVAEFDIWQVQRGSSDDDVDVDLELAEFGFGDEIENEEAPPLLNHWGIAVIDNVPAGMPPYLIFSSHTDMLIEVAKRISSGKRDGMAAQADVKEVMTRMKDLGAKEVALDRVIRTRLSIRSRYELLRQGKLRESDSILANMLKRMDEEEQGGEPDPIDAKKLPPLATIENYLRDGGSFWEKTEEGWSLTGFFLR